MSDQGSNHFKDHFSATAREYANFRPSYPASLFDWLVSISPGRALAVDLATGNGQAARDLIDRFDRVVALDASAEQIARCQSQPGVEFRHAPAEQTGLPDHCADLITIAQALHWFDLDAFYIEARRILKPDGVIAAWTYELFDTGSATINRIVDHFYHDVLDGYWPPERRWVESGYADLPFPFERIESPPMNMEAHWTLADVVGYLSTWSAVQRYRNARGADPIPILAESLRVAWGEGRRKVVWPLPILAGRTRHPG